MCRSPALAGDFAVLFPIHRCKSALLFLHDSPPHEGLRRIAPDLWSLSNWRTTPPDRIANPFARFCVVISFMK
jgi:hypothetical protein